MKRFFERLFPGTRAAFMEILKDYLCQEKRMFLVTANPEAFMLGKTDKEMETLLHVPEPTLRKRMQRLKEIIKEYFK